MLGPFGLRQDDAAAHHRGLRTADGGSRAARRCRHHAGRRPPPPAQHGLPAPDAVPAPRRRRQRRLRPAGRRDRARRAGCPRRRGAAAGAARGLRQAAGRRALGRPDAAHRARPRARQPARACCCSTSRSRRSISRSGSRWRWSCGASTARSGATFVYVTHDQREALALSDRVVVFNEGRVDPGRNAGRDLPRARPSPFAARFVGDANVLPRTASRASRAGMRR